MAVVSVICEPDAKLLLRNSPTSPVLASSLVPVPATPCVAWLSKLIDPVIVAPASGNFVSAYCLGAACNDVDGSPGSTIAPVIVPPVVGKKPTPPTCASTYCFVAGLSADGGSCANTMSPVIAPPVSGNAPA